MTAIQIRRGLAADWYNVSAPYSVASPYNPVLALGEIGYETDTKQFKIGDGTTKWLALNYFTQTGVALGAASLDSTGVIPVAQMPTISNKFTTATWAAALSLSMTTYAYQKFTMGGTTQLTFTNWPASGVVGELFLEVWNGASSTLNWPVVNWVKSDGTISTGTVNSTLPSVVASLQTTGVDFIFLWTHDGGTTIYGKVMR